MADTTEDDVDTGNYQMVSVNGGGMVVVLAPRQQMTREAALLHAAWLVAMATPEAGEFERILAAVQNS
jgi:hypothetical protein